MIPSIEIRPGGKVFWLPGPGSKHEPGWKEVTHVTPRFLWESCRLAEGVTLRDLFTILRNDLDFYEVLIGNWVAEIVSEGLDKDPEESDLEYLNLSWMLTVSDHWDEKAQAHTEGKAISGFSFPDFHGIGKDGEGNQITYSVGFTPLYKMVDLPIKLDRKFVVSDEAEFFRAHKRTGQYPKRGEFDISYEDCTFNLLQVLYGIVWELSFFGGPKERDETAEEMNRRVAEIESGEAVTYSLEEVMESLKERIGELKKDEEEE